MGRGHAALRGAIGISLVTALSIPAMNAVPAVAGPPRAVNCEKHPDWWLCKLFGKTTSRQRSTMESIGFDVVAHVASVAPKPPDMPPPPPGDPCADTTTVSTEPSEVAASPGPEATVTFQKGDDGPTVSETLTEVGVEAATVAIDQLKQILERCPVTEDENVRTTLSPWRSADLGDASIGYTVLIESKWPGEPSVRFRTALIAQDEVLAHFTMVDGDQADAAQFKDIVQTCAANLAAPADTPPPYSGPDPD